MIAWMMGKTTHVFGIIGNLNGIPPMKHFTNLITDILNEEHKTYQHGVYISTDLYHGTQDITNIKKYIKDIFNITLKEHKLHCTLIYSKKDHTKLKVSELNLDPKKKFNSTIKEVTVWQDNNNISYLGIKLDSKDLVDENTRLMKFGFVSDFDSYMPHITLQYDTKLNLDTDKELFKEVNEYFKDKNYTIIFHNEHIEPLDEQWGE